MAFDRNNEKLTEALRNSTDVIKKTKEVNLNIPQNTENEKTKGYTFTLQPSVREKLTEKANQYGYSSASKFLAELIKNL